MKKIKIPDGGMVELTIGEEVRELDVFDVSEELEQRISPHRNSKDPNDKAWIAVVVDWIKEEYGVKVSKLVALAFYNAISKEYGKVADFFIEKPDSSSTLELTPEGLPLGKSAGD